MSSRRRFKFSGCGHLGLGAECQRCAEAAKLETRATEVEAYFDAVAAKNVKSEPGWLTYDKEKGQYVASGAPKKFTAPGAAVPSAPQSIGKQFGQAMREEAARLRAPQSAKSKAGRLVDGTASSSMSLADSMS